MNITIAITGIICATLVVLYGMSCATKSKDIELTKAKKELAEAERKRDMQLRSGGIQKR